MPGKVLLFRYMYLPMQVSPKVVSPKSAAKTAVDGSSTQSTAAAKIILILLISNTLVMSILHKLYHMGGTC